VIRLIDILAITLCVVIGLNWASIKYMPVIEGLYWPVVTEIVITGRTVYPPPGHRYRYSGTAEKLRDCRYVSIEWYFGARGGDRVPVTVFFSDPPAVNKPGTLTWTGLIVSMEPENLEENSHADVIHRCPGRWWETRSRFFTSAPRT